MTCLDPSCKLGKYGLKVICPARKFTFMGVLDGTFSSPDDPYLHQLQQMTLKRRNEAWNLIQKCHLVN